MNHPAQYWVKYLLSTNRHSHEQISGIMEMYDLGALSMSYLSLIEDELEQDKPVPFRPRSKSHKPSQAFLRRNGIYKAWHRDPSMECAMEIICTPRVRSLVEMFLLSPVQPNQAVAKICDKEPSFRITVEGYKRFKHYFWNTELLSAAEWGEYIQSRNVAHNDWLRLAVNARGPEGTQLLLWKAGVGALKNLDRAKIFTDFRNIAYMKAKELEAQPASIDDSKALLNYSRVAKAAQEEVNNSSDAVNDILEGFNAFRMKRRNLNAPSITQLTGGNFTHAESVEAMEDKIEY